jgi:hypothetical protein
MTAEWHLQRKRILGDMPSQRRGWRRDTRSQEDKESEIQLQRGSKKTDHKRKLVDKASGSGSLRDTAEARPIAAGSTCRRPGIAQAARCLCGKKSQRGN